MTQNFNFSFFSKMTIPALALLALSGCASYQASSLNQMSTGIIKTTASQQEDVIVTAKAFNKNDCKRYLDRDVIRQGYQPVQISIQNDSEQTYVFPLSSVSPSPARPDEVARTVHTSTIGRAVGYGAPALIIWPLIIPAVVDGMKSAEANNQLDMDYSAKAAKDSLIFAHSQTNALVFIPKGNVTDTLKLTLIDQKSNQPLTFDVKIAR